MAGNLFDTLQERGYLYQFTNKDAVRKMLNGERITAYIGVDPTADSLHIGHCLPLVIGSYLQEAGHRVIVIIGGATAMIGDPSSKNDMRKMVSSDFINQNRPGIEKAIGKFLKLDGDNPALILNNADWYKGYDYIDFMRDIGVHFNVNKMLACDAYKNRIANGGLTFFEMGYMLMQAYDFVYLNRKYGCTLEFGGSDQWGNIVAGAELGRKLNNISNEEDTTFQAFTNTLLLNADGTKMGKSEKGAVWVSADKYSPLDFYQYFYNRDDRDTEKMLKMLTKLPLDEISTIMQGDIRDAKRRMAYEVAKLVHGEEKAKEAMETATGMFNNNYDNVPEYHLTDLDNNIVDVLANAKLVNTKSEGRRMIDGKAVTVDGEIVSDYQLDITKLVESNGFAIIKKGKKNIIKVVK